VIAARNLLLITLVALTVAGCKPRPAPDEVTTIKTPQPDIHLTYEYWNLGMLVSDSARLVAHLVKDGVEDKQIVLDGNYISIRSITWPAPDHLVVCVTALDEVHKDWARKVTLSAGGLSKTLKVELWAVVRFDNGSNSPPKGSKCLIKAD
jgi:hypothetical protein